MTAPLGKRKVLQVLRLYFEGHPLDAVARYADVAKGSVEEILRRLKAGEYEEFSDATELVDVYREIAVFVRKDMNGDVQRCFVGSAVWSALCRLGLEPGIVKEWARFCEDLVPADVPKPDFVRIAMWAHDLQERVSVNLVDLPRHLETLVEKLETLRAELAALESEVHTVKASAGSLRTELDLLEDIKGLREVRRAEESRVAEEKGRAKAAVRESGVTLETLEQFRVLTGTAKAKGVPVDGELFDTLLALIASLGPAGIRQVEELRSLLAKEGLTATDGIALFGGLWSRGLTLRRATSIVRALRARGSFSAALNRLVSLLDKCGTLEVAVATLREEQHELSRKEAAKQAELAQLDRTLSSQWGVLADVQRHVKAATDEKDRIQSETKVLLEDRRAGIDSLDAEAAQERKRIEAERRAIISGKEAEIASIEAVRQKAEDVARNATAAAAKALRTQATAEAVASELARQQGEVARLQPLLPALGRNLGTLVRKTREASAAIQVAAYVPALAKGRKEGLGAFVAAAKSGLLEKWEAQDPRLSEATARWLQKELIDAQGGALVAKEVHDRACADRDGENANLRSAAQQRQRDLAEARGELDAERKSFAEYRFAKDAEVQKLGGRLRSAEDAQRRLEGKLRLLQNVLPTVGGKQFESVDGFHEALRKALQGEARAKAVGMYQGWQRKAMIEGRIVAVGQHRRGVTCPNRHAFEISVTSKYVAEVIAGLRSGAILLRLRRPGVAVETCPRCGMNVELTMDDLVG